MTWGGEKKGRAKNLLSGAAEALPAASWTSQQFSRLSPPSLFFVAQKQPLSVYSKTLEECHLTKHSRLVGGQVSNGTTDVMPLSESLRNEILSSGDRRESAQHPGSRLGRLLRTEGQSGIGAEISDWNRAVVCHCEPEIKLTTTALGATSWLVLVGREQDGVVTVNGLFRA